MRRGFDRALTLYTETDGGFVKSTVCGASLRVTDLPDGKRSATVYLPLFLHRKEKYLFPEEFSGEKGTFTVFVGQRAVIGKCDNDTPPENALTVTEIYYALTGSRRVQHLKIKLITSKKEENIYEGTDN
jgi:hypothetical protein